MQYLETRRTAVAIILGIFTLTAGWLQHAGADEPVQGSDVLVDGDFETVPPGNRLPRRWLVLPEAARRGAFQIVGGVAHKGKRCLRLDPMNAGKEIYGILQLVPTEHLRGKRVTLRGRVRTDGLAGGGATAGMALVIGGPKLRTVPADTGGQFREISVTREVPADARQVVVLLLVRGTKGHAYFDGIELLVPGARKKTKKHPMAPEYFAVASATLAGQNYNEIVKDPLRQVSHARVSNDHQWIVFSRFNRLSRYGVALEDEGYDQTSIIRIQHSVVLAGDRFGEGCEDYFWREEIA